MESSSHAEAASWRPSAVYSRIFRPRPATRKIKKRGSLPVQGPASASAPALAQSLAAPTPAPTSARQVSPRATASAAAAAAASNARHDEEEFTNTKRHTFQAKTISSKPSSS
jgi:sugar (pentulose or hexulose) kinase